MSTMPALTKYRKWKETVGVDAEVIAMAKNKWAFKEVNHLNAIL